ncbi:ATP-binding protein [Halalkalibacter nanhaiisediminis]|uniref:histidine kinase n=1 Tax=Halalkalibacter nanhaiisediminis TaxID=688079 RepID=A0A562QQT0_9BACI|nr:ATP-binding protein [Halalkalibacter nanhaiisediminis]TWI59084.1 PAS domain S-box-containing protein [Halalkalibacter nanhaiisediminis]
MRTLKSSLFWKIFIINLLIMLTLLGLIFFKSQITLPEIAAEKYKKMTDETVLRLNDQIQNITNDLRELGSYIQSNDYFRDQNIDQLNNQLEEVINLSPYIDSGTIVDSKGIVIGYYPEDLEYLRNQSLQDRKYVQTAIETKEVYISEVISATTNRYILVVAIPILDDRGEVTRVANLTIRLEDNPLIKSIIQNIELGDGYAFIIDRYGRLISHPDRIGEDVSTNKVVQMVLNQQSGYDEITNTQGVRMLASFQYIPALDWGVIAQVPVSDTDVYFQSFQNSLLIFSLLLFFFLTIFTALYARQMIKPLRKLYESVGQVAKGNYSERINRKHIDHTEIGLLSKRFNDMAEYIEEANEKIEAKEKLLVYQKEFLRKVIDTSPNFIFAKNSQGQYTLANRSTAMFYGVSVEEMLWKAEADFNSDVEQLARHEEEDRFVMEKSQGIFIAEEKLLDKAGNVIWVQTTKIPLVLADGKEVHVLSVSNDITERKLAEDIIRKSSKLSAVGELAAGVAHEIRNPLTSIQGFLQFLEPKYEDKHYFEIMLSEIDRIKLIIGELLVLSKPQAEKNEYKDVRVICQMIINLFEAQAHLNNVQINTEYDADLPNIWCEENQLKQVFVNILKNAIESMPNGGNITVKVTAKDDHHVSIYFIDNGIGMEQERVERLGEPFYSTKEKGTGLGLMVSFRIIENHNGKIMIKSEKNKGTTVEVILPVSTGQN